MSTRERLTIGIDIGGTSVRAAAVDADCRIVDTLWAPTPDTVAATEDLLAAQIGELAARHPVTAAGLAVAGFLDIDRRRVMFAPHLAWRGEEVPDRLAERVGLPVVMDHDVNSAAWAEYRHGAAAGASVALLVALGTGIGAGLVLDGKLFRGAHGVAPELGHLVLVPGGRLCPCGKRGCWERYCSGTALVATATELLSDGGRSRLKPGVALTGAVVAAAAAAGDQVAGQAMAELGRWLGAGLAMAADVLDPEVIVIGGGVAAAAPSYLPLATEFMQDQLTGAGYRPAPRIEVAAFGASAGLIGAAILAAESVCPPRDLAD